MTDIFFSKKHIIHKPLSSKVSLFMKIHNIDVSMVINDAQDLLKKDENMSPELKDALDTMLDLANAMLTALSLDSKN